MCRCMHACVHVVYRADVYRMYCLANIMGQVLDRVCLSVCEYV